MAERLDGCARRSVRGTGQMDVAHAHFATPVHIPLPAQTAKPLMGVLVSAVQRLMP